IIFLLILLLHFMLSVYFSKAKVPLGSDLLAYSMDEILLTAKAGGGFSFLSILIFILLFTAVILFIRYLDTKSDVFLRRKKLFIPLFTGLLLISFLLKKERVNSIPEFENSLA